MAEVHAQVTAVSVSKQQIAVELADGRTIVVPLLWYPRLHHGTAKERKNWRLTGEGEGIHWPDLDEDVSVRNLVLGQPSGESQQSFKTWLERRQRGRIRKKTAR